MVQVSETVCYCEYGEHIYGECLLLVMQVDTVTYLGSLPWFYSFMATYYIITTMIENFDLD